MSEDRIAKLELVTSRLMRRAHKKAVAMITPYPISNAVFGEDVKGSILRYMFPCDGKVNKGMIKLGSKVKKGIVSLVIQISNDNGSKSAGFTIDKKMIAVEPNIEVNAGDCLDITILSSEESIKEVWISFLWIPTTKDVEVKSFLIEELESDISEG